MFMEINSGNFNCGLSRGTSTTWGNVPAGGWQLSIPTTMTGFPNYQSQDSIARSGIWLGANRIQSINLRQVRTYDGTGFSASLLGLPLYP
jgi:hypothetical protein